MAASIPSGERQRDSSTSANKGIAPKNITASFVAINVNGVQITSSPYPIPAAARAQVIAAVPLETP